MTTNNSLVQSGPVAQKVRKPRHRFVAGDCVKINVDNAKFGVYGTKKLCVGNLVKETKPGIWRVEWDYSCDPNGGDEVSFKVAILPESAFSLVYAVPSYAKDFNPRAM